MPGRVKEVKEMWLDLRQVVLGSDEPISPAFEGQSEGARPVKVDPMAEQLRAVLEEQGVVLELLVA